MQLEEVLGQVQHTEDVWEPMQLGEVLGQVQHTEDVWEPMQLGQVLGQVQHTEEVQQIRLVVVIREGYQGQGSNRLEAVRSIAVQYFLKVEVLPKHVEAGKDLASQSNPRFRMERLAARLEHQLKQLARSE